MSQNMNQTGTTEFDRWQQRFAAPGYLFGTAPNAFLKSQAPLLRQGQTALAIADGEGRNGVFLAEQGLDVLSLDYSLVAQEKARALAKERGVRLRIEQADMTSDDLCRHQGHVKARRLAIAAGLSAKAARLQDRRPVRRDAVLYL
jgi:hypothetical protein